MKQLTSQIICFIKNMSISGDLFTVDTPNAITALSIISRRLRSKKHVFPTNEKYLAFFKDIKPYLKGPKETGRSSLRP